MWNPFLTDCLVILFLLGCVYSTWKAVVALCELVDASVELWRGEREAFKPTPRRNNKVGGGTNDWNQ